MTCLDLPSVAFHRPLYLVGYLSPAKEHRLNESTVRGWVYRMKKGKGIFDSIGRPPILDDIADQSISESLKKKR